MFVQIASLVFVALLLVAAYSDATRYLIPNWVSAAIVLLFPLAALLAGIGWGAAGLHLAAGLAGLLVGMALVAGRLMGAGDGKLFAAAALWFGWPLTVAFLIHTVFVGGGLALALLLLRRALPVAGFPAEVLADTALAPKAPVPYGIAIAGGAIWTLPSTIFALAV